ncbi:CsbD family protein [Leucobacter sp. CSA1]|uniref:CsbD family protein n=1 Tax=Leucobacter chromiisoli TaxID=2796471 RepID=A0A934UVF6_9MICO|nr:CsbD family protein [Leucobacter chromiisoli]MBK0419163.1 CsbD family protein [Leucobacter chromiisoli]
MSASDKVSAGMDKLKGNAKEAAGKVTDNERLVAEGKADQVKGELKDAKEQAKDGVKDALDD